METPYTTRTIQPPPEQGGRKPEVFKTQGEQSKRSVLDGIARDMESIDPKDNLRALSASKNTGTLETSAGRSTGVENISAPVPGTDKEISLGSMIENGALTPSDSMKEMADRHGLDLPSKNSQGPDPTAWENSPEMLKLPKPEGELQNPGLRELTGKLTEEINQPTLQKAEAVQSLDKAMGSILSPQEKMATGLQPETPSTEEPKLPWLKKEGQSKEDGPVNPVALFEDAGKKLQALPDKEREGLLGDYFQDKMGKAQEFTAGVKQKEEKEQSLLSDVTTAIFGTKEKNDKMFSELLNPHTILGNGKDMFQALKEGNIGQAADSATKLPQAIWGLGDKEKEKISKRFEESGVTAQSMAFNPIETGKKAMGIIVGVLSEDRKEAVGRITKFLVGDKDDKDSLKGWDAVNPTKIFDRFQGKDQEQEKEGSEKSDSKKGKSTDVVTTRSTPGMKAFKAGIEFFQEAASNKPVGEKMVGMGKAATKAVVSMAQGVGTKMAGAAAAGPAAPIAIAAMVVATTLKFALEPILGELKQESKPERSKEKDENEDKKDKGGKDDTKSPLDSAIDWFMPGTGGKKGLALKGALAGTKKGAEWAKDDATSAKADAKADQQKKNAPDLNMN